MCLPWLMWVVPEVLAILDVVVYLVSTIVVEHRNDRTDETGAELRDVRLAIWAGFTASAIVAYVAFGTRYSLLALTSFCKI